MQVRTTQEGRRQTGTEDGYRERVRYRDLVLFPLLRNAASGLHPFSGQYDRNVRPLTVSRDIDFSENGSIENADKVQSEHWTSIQYTLFISVLSFLLVDE